MRIRCEATSHAAGEIRTSVAYVDIDVLTPARRQALEPIVAELVAGIDHPDAAAVLLGYLTERLADENAYEREAARRGVLAL